jgi:hypothetical protein
LSTLKRVANPKFEDHCGFYFGQMLWILFWNSIINRKPNLRTCVCNFFFHNNRTVSLFGLSGLRYFNACLIVKLEWRAQKQTYVETNKSAMLISWIFDKLTIFYAFRKRIQQARKFKQTHISLYWGANLIYVGSKFLIFCK